MNTPRRLPAGLTLGLTLGLSLLLGLSPAHLRADESASPRTRPAAEGESRKGPGPGASPREDKGRGPRANDSIRREPPAYDAEGAFRDGPNLSPEQMKEAISILREIDPAKAQRLETWLKSNPDTAKGVVMPAMPKLMHLSMLRRNNPEMYQLRLTDMKLANDTEELARQYRQAGEAKDTAKANALAQQVKGKLAEHFQLRQKIQERELAMLEKRIAELREQIAARKTSQDQLIEDRFIDLTSRVNKPEW